MVGETPDHHRALPERAHFRKTRRLNFQQDIRRAQNGGRIAELVPKVEAGMVAALAIEAREQMKQTQAKDVLIAMPGLPEEKLLALVHELQPTCGYVYVVPQLWGLPMMNLQVDAWAA